MHPPGKIRAMTVNNPCVFCESTTNQMSKQHLFGKRLRAEFSDITTTGWSSIQSGDELVTAYQAPPFTLEVGGFCTTCNGGWMERIESATIPLLLSMAHDDRATVLTPSMQRLLSSWATEQAMVFDLVDPRIRVIPDSEYRSFCSVEQPLRNHTIWIGRTAMTAENLIYMNKSLIQRLVLRCDPNLEQRLVSAAKQGLWNFVITFFIGFTVFQIISSALPESLDLVMSDVHRRTMSRIWPVQGNVSWPPSTALPTVHDVQDLHTSVAAPPT